MLLRESSEAEPQPLRYLGPKTFQHHIRLGSQSLKRLEPPYRFEIDADGALVTTEREVRGVPPVLGCVRHCFRERFDQYDVGAHVREQHRAIRTRRKPREIQDANAVERAKHGPRLASLSPRALRCDMSSVRSAEFVAGAKSAAELPPPVMSEVAFAGRSNVGKSSLINTLAERKNLVRTSSTPGCTRQISFFELDLGDGARITLVDLPGYGYAKRSKEERSSWADLIESYLLGRATLKAVVSIIDVRRGLEPDDRDLLELLQSPARVSRAPLSVIVVATKLDKLPRSKQKLELERVRQAAGVPVLGFSAVDGTGKDLLWQRLRRAADLADRATV